MTVIDLLKSEGQAFAQEFSARNGGNTLFVRADVTFGHEHSFDTDGSLLVIKASLTGRSNIPENAENRKVRRCKWL